MKLPASVRKLQNLAGKLQPFVMLPVSPGNDHRPCGKVCGCDVFISRSPRSSRMSRDLEKMLSRFFGLGFEGSSLGFARSR